MADRRLQREFKEWRRTAPANICASPIKGDIYAWRATITGPENTPYAGGTFYCDVTVPSDYPFVPPRVIFRTKIYHVNITKSGSGFTRFGGLPSRLLGQSTNNQWSPAESISNILTAINQLLKQPDPTDQIVIEDIKQLLLNDRNQHDDIAREWTKKYAFSGSIEEQEKMANELLFVESDDDDESIGSVSSWNDVEPEEDSRSGDNLNTPMSTTISIPSTASSMPFVSPTCFVDLDDYTDKGVLGRSEQFSLDSPPGAISVGQNSTSKASVNVESAIGDIETGNTPLSSSSTRPGTSPETRASMYDEDDDNNTIATNDSFQKQRREIAINKNMNDINVIAQFFQQAGVGEENAVKCAELIVIDHNVKTLKKMQVTCSALFLLL